MNFEEAEAALHKALASAAPARLRSFAEAGAGRLLNDPAVEPAFSDGELNPSASTALQAARAQWRTADAKTLLSWLDAVEQGHQDEGNMSAELAFALAGLEGWAMLLRGKHDGVQLIADTLLERADWLGAAGEQAEYDWIFRALG
jgi:hypothetical protein